MTDTEMITPEQAAILLGMTLGKLSHYVVGTGPPANDPPAIRLGWVDGRPMVYLGDVLRMKNVPAPLEPAMAGSPS